MQVTSTKGLIDIVSHEGICLNPYLDSVGVWTIGIGQTAHDGFDPRTAGPLTIKGAFDLFREKIKPYEAAVRALGRELNQHQFDALVSFAFNAGPGNLRKLCKPSRSLYDIGLAFSLYNIPPEIIDRRRKEQKLFRTGQYDNVSGKVSVFPVGPNHKPQYHKAKLIDVRPYLMPSNAGRDATVSGTVAGGVTAGAAEATGFSLSDPWVMAAAFAVFFAVVLGVYIYKQWSKSDGSIEEIE